MVKIWKYSLQALQFFGFFVAWVLYERGDKVVGVDNLNDYYDVGLKQTMLITRYQQFYKTS